MTFAAKRATRHPANGLGWMFLQEPEAQLLERGAPPKVHPDHKVSGQNPEYTAWAWEVTTCFANQPTYRKQIEAELDQIAKEQEVALAALTRAADELDQLEQRRWRVQGLLSPVEAE